ncbi:MAG: sugar phosphate isomerase/epimerase [Chloroflexaceae bacterium]|jgi:sugar phosphate isomerase/epimerase|nr:sugar phosphate isomerase/epimerase [Chloroflexaceae bacterium]
MLRFAYNTNGVSNHRLDDALALIADSGYDGVALTLDHHHLDPFAPDLHRRAERLGAWLAARGLGLVIETGARFLLDPRRKHEPTLVSPEPEGRARRIEFLTRALDVAAVCGAEAVSFWAGVPQPGVDHATAWGYLEEGLAEVAHRAETRGVVAALEPEPGMLVATLDDYLRLHERVALPLALDLGHCLVTGEREPAAAVAEFAPLLGTVTIEDMRRGVHEHLPFGEGDMDVAAALRALQAIRFSRLVCVELSRDSHRAHTMVPEALTRLKQSMKYE